MLPERVSTASGARDVEMLPCRRVPGHLIGSEATHAVFVGSAAAVRGDGPDDGGRCVHVALLLAVLVVTVLDSLKPAPMGLQTRVIRVPCISLMNIGADCSAGQCVERGIRRTSRVHGVAQRRREGRDRAVRRSDSDAPSTSCGGEHPTGPLRPTSPRRRTRTLRQHQPLGGVGARADRGASG